MLPEDPGNSEMPNDEVPKPPKSTWQKVDGENLKNNNNYSDEYAKAALGGKFGIPPALSYVLPPNTPGNIELGTNDPQILAMQITHLNTDIDIVRSYIRRQNPSDPVWKAEARGYYGKIASNQMIIAFIQAKLAVKL